MSSSRRHSVAFSQSTTPPHNRPPPTTLPQSPAGLTAGGCFVYGWPHVSARPPLLEPLDHDSRQQAQVGHKIKDARSQRSQPGLHPCAVFGQFVAHQLALVNGAAIGLRGHRDRIKMTRPLFKLSNVIEHIKKVSRVAGFYAITRREMNLTSVGDAPEKNAPAAAIRTATCRTREKFMVSCPKDLVPTHQWAQRETAIRGREQFAALAVRVRVLPCALGPRLEPTVFQRQG